MRDDRWPSPCRYCVVYGRIQLYVIDPSPQEPPRLPRFFLSFSGLRESPVYEFYRLTWTLSTLPPSPSSFPLSPSPMQLIRSILAAGANPNIYTPLAITPVALAAQLGHSRCLTVLLSSGASPHHVVRDNVPTPLQWTIISLNPTCLAFLLAAGANPEERRRCSSSFFDAKMQKSLSKNHRPSSPGARVIRLLRVAEVFGARSWQWAKEQVCEGVGVEEPMEGSTGGLQGSASIGPTAGASWMAPRRGIFVPAVLR